MRFINLTVCFLILWGSTAWGADAWFVGPMVRRNPPKVTAFHNTVHRGCAIFDLASQIMEDGGKWRAIEMLGNKCLIRVKASANMIGLIVQDGRFKRIPAALFHDKLSTLTAGQRAALRQVVLDAGYPVEEVTAHFPNLGQATLAEVLRFMVRRRITPRYDPATDTIVLDGPVVTQPDSLVDTAERDVQ